MQLEEIVWAAIDGFDGLYEVSNAGDVRSLDRRVPVAGRGWANLRGKGLKKKIDHEGYEAVELSKNGRLYTRKVHRLVAICFVLNPESAPEVNHKDLDKKNNKASNLEWVTRAENARHAAEAGRFLKLLPAQRRDIRRLVRSGLQKQQVAAMFGVNRNTIRKICREAAEVCL